MRRAFIVVVALGLIATAIAVLVYAERRRAEQEPGVVTLESAWARVRRKPRDANAWAALGDAQATIDQLHASEEAYRTALRLRPGDESIHARLGFLLYGWGRDRDALIELERAQVLGAEVEMLDYTLAQIRRQLAARKKPPERVAVVEPTPVEPEDADDGDSAPCTVEVWRSSRLGTFRIDVQIETLAATLVVDTGASLTAITRELLVEAGVTIDEERTITAITAVGPAQFPTAVVGSITVAGRAVRQLRVAVCEQCAGKDADGLLGLDVQAPLGMELDVRQSVVRFIECDDD